MALSPKMGEVVLDMCAAPGSKTTQIASEAADKIDIVANDSSKDRLYKLKHVLSSQGVTNCLVTSYPGQLLWKKYPQYFDAILLDAPCSMMQKSGESNKKAKLLVPKQRYLLRSALSCCKVGGRIIYSTCSISPIEGEEVIDWLIQKNPSSVECNYQVRIQPDELAEGFFLACLTKLSPNL
jgi:16S rRNA (cytosine1407-C5)-methyltransferase